MADETAQDTGKPVLPPTKSIVLTKPVTLGNKTYETLELCEPNGDQVDKFLQASGKPGQEWAAGMLLVSLVAGVELPVVKRIGASQIQEAQQYLLGFIATGPETGAS